MKKFLLLEVTMAMLASLAGRAAPAGDPLDHWQQLNPDVNLYDLREVRFGGNRWVAINHGYLPSPPLILSSLDGTNWVRTYQAPAGYLMRSLDFGGSRWIATAADNSGNSSVVTSEDGLVWTPIPNVRFYQVSYGNGRWLALGYGSTFFRSVDGITWQEARSELALPLEDNPSLVFGDGQWLALGLRFSSGGTQPQQELISSPDGDTWTVHPLPDEVRDPASHRGFPASLAYGNGSWVLQYGSCSGPAGPCTNVIWKSDDGRT